MENETLIRLRKHVCPIRLKRLTDLVFDVFEKRDADTLTGFLIALTMTVAGASIIKISLRELIETVVLTASKSSYPENDVNEFITLLGIKSPKEQIEEIEDRIKEVENKMKNTEGGDESGN
jgi:hypothetical protein